MYNSQRSIQGDQRAEREGLRHYTLEMISEKFSDIMWLFNQYVFSNVASRLADTILEHRSLAGSDTLKITHDALARDIGTARRSRDQAAKTISDRRSGKTYTRPH